ncbi:elongation factor 1-beta [archaeon]|jgi:elongation factor 1-beta|nr:elongation factor 1-beta [archaeon]MBT4373846.1 elongation factor 1-beta [archaeon]MBT4532368.1 elongation factor 1-beta [archaeon]MBT7001749.1 elongation factor 1-beta [archaeon]MBT7281926.1 elongation factor 1-beta [archaeon]
MGTALLKIKVMPESPETNLEELQEKAKEILEKNSAKGIKFDIEPIAFGLKSLIIGFGVDESQELEPIENALKSMENISSSEVIDMRRAIE